MLLALPAWVCCHCSTHQRARPAGAIISTGVVDGGVPRGRSRTTTGEGMTNGMRSELGYGGNRRAAPRRVRRGPSTGPQARSPVCRARSSAAPRPARSPRGGRAAVGAVVAARAGRGGLGPSAPGVRVPLRLGVPKGADVQGRRENGPACCAARPCSCRATPRRGAGLLLRREALGSRGRRSPAPRLAVAAARAGRAAPRIGRTVLTTALDVRDPSVRRPWAAPTPGADGSTAAATRAATTAPTVAFSRPAATVRDEGQPTIGPEQTGQRAWVRWWRVLGPRLARLGAARGLPGPRARTATDRHPEHGALQVGHPLRRQRFDTGRAARLRPRPPVLMDRNLQGRPPLAPLVRRRGVAVASPRPQREQVGRDAQRLLLLGDRLPLLPLSVLTA